MHGPDGIWEVRLIGVQMVATDKQDTDDRAKFCTL